MYLLLLVTIGTPQALNSSDYLVLMAGVGLPECVSQSSVPLQPQPEAQWDFLPSHCLRPHPLTPSRRLLLFFTPFLMSWGLEVGRHFLMCIFKPHLRQALYTLVSGVGPCHDPVPFLVAEHFFLSLPKK